MTLPDFTTTALLVIILGLFTGSLVKGVRSCVGRRRETGEVG